MYFEMFAEGAEEHVLNMTAPPTRLTSFANRDLVAGIAEFQETLGYARTPEDVAHCVYWHRIYQGAG